MRIKLKLAQRTDAKLIYKNIFTLCRSRNIFCAIFYFENMSQLILNNKSQSYKVLFKLIC